MLLASLVAAVFAAVALPSDYEEVAFLESTGTQWIDTGIEPDRTTVVSLDWQSLKEAGESFQVLAGSKDTAATANQMTVMIGSANNLQGGVLGASGPATPDVSWPEGSRHAVTLDAVSNAIFFDGQKVKDTTSAVDSLPSLYLFARHSPTAGAEAFACGRLYGCQIRQGGDLVRDYVPVCRKADGAIGLYDRVTGEFCQNGGASDFEAPMPETAIVKLKYVESSGSQWFDTNVKPDRTTVVSLDWQSLKAANATFQVLVGTKDAAGTPNQMTAMIGSANNLQGGVLGVSGPATPDIPWPEGSRHAVTLDAVSNAIFFDGQKVKDTTAAVNSLPSLYLFARHSPTAGAEAFASGRFYGCQIRKGGDLVRDYVPARRKADGVVGLYDRVTGMFSRSGGTLVAGPTTDHIEIVGSPKNLGVPDPDYGFVDSLVMGQTYTFDPPADVETDGMKFHCTGWEFVPDDGETLRGTGRANLTYTGTGRLTWFLDVQYKVIATAGTGGTVSPTSTWVVADTSFPISAKASDGYSFYRWSGDANSTDAEIEMTVDGPKSVKALFAIETHVSTKEEFSTALTEALSSIKAGEICAETIWLADGNYQLAAKTTIDVPIKIRSESDDPTKVVFSPDKENTHEMFVVAHADAALSGLTVQGGYGTGDQSYSTYGGAQGADVTITSAGGTVENCILRNAKGGKGWGTCASALKQGGGLVSRCVISNCSSSCDWGNYCSYGNAALVYGGVMENTLITKNSGGGSDAGGGAICLAGTGKMINCTVAGNSMNGYAGIFIDGTSAKAINCLICNNTSAHRTEDFAGVYNGSSVASYFTACVAPVQINGSCHTEAGLGLKDAGHGDYHPILGSVCLDNGTLDGITPSALDLDGNARIDEDSGKIDVGCYELNLEGIAASVTCTPADTQGLVPVTRTFSSLVQGGTPTAYEWSINGEVLPGETGDTLSRTFTKAGSYTVSLKVSDAKGTYDAVNDVLITAFPTNVYVDATSATPVAPYDTPETAAKTFADAYAAAGDYSVILIAPNNYSRTSQITISKKVTVRGTGKSPLDTILSLALKNNTYGRVMQMNCKEALVCNLTLEGGWVNTQNGKGAGVYIADKGGTVSNCVIRSCKCGAGDECGGGAFLGCADACITHCVFTNCSVVGESCGQNSGARGGFAASITAGTLRDSLIVGCYQDGLNKDFPGDDGAVAMHGGKLVNCTIVGCRAEECAGIRAGGGQVINCIVSGNTTTSSNPTNAVWRGSGTTVRNSLADQDVGGKFASEEAALTFVGTGTHRYRLRTGSKAIDAGDASEVTSTADLRGNPRVQCGAVDIGCYEKKIGMAIFVR